MSRFLKRISLTIIMLCLFVTGCGNQKTAQVTIGITLNGLPYEYRHYHIKVITFKEITENNYTTYKPTATFSYNNISNSNQLEDTILVNKDTFGIGFYLFEDEMSSRPVYFSEIKYQPTNKKYIVSYWLDYYEYFSFNIIAYGISAQFERQISYNQKVEQDFNNAPYYLYKVSSTKEKYNEIFFEVLEGEVKCAYAESLDSLIKGYPKTITSNETIQLDNYDYDNLYFLMVPQNYSIESLSSLIVKDNTEDYFKRQRASFEFYHCEMGADGNIYFADRTNEMLKQWSFTEKTFVEKQNFSDQIASMIIGDSDLYIGEGARLWQYNTLTGVNEHKYNARGLINSIYYIGDYLICNDNSGFWSTNQLIRLSDFTVTSFTDMLHPSSTYVHIPSQNRVYILNDGISPDILCYQEFDLSTETLTTYSKNRVDYAMGHPLRQLGSELKIACASGIVFNISGEIDYHSNLGTTYNDFVIYDDKIYLLNTTESDRYPYAQTATLYIMDRTEPYSVISTPLQYENRTGKRLFIDGNELVIVTQNRGSYSETRGEIFVEKCSFAQLQSTQSIRTPGNYHNIVILTENNVGFLK